MASVRRSPISIKRVIEEVMESSRQEIEQKQLTLVADTGQDDLLVEADATKIAMALSNLVQNAATYTDPAATSSLWLARSRIMSRCR